MFDDKTFRNTTKKNKGMMYHEPSGPRSNLDYCKHVNWSLQKMDIDNSKAMKYRPKTDMITRGKPGAGNVTHMGRYAGSGEAFDGVNKTDSVSKHVKHGREFSLRM